MSFLRIEPALGGAGGVHSVKDAEAEGSSPMCGVSRAGSRAPGHPRGVTRAGSREGVARGRGDTTVLLRTGYSEARTGYGSTVTLMASPFLTMSKTLMASDRGTWRVMRSLTGTWPVAMYSSARLLWSGEEPFAPWTCSWR